MNERESAGDAGCTCPVMDNGRGRGYLGGVLGDGKTIFVVNEDPIHGSKG